MTARSLTPGELALARSVFKDAIDYSRVSIHDARVLPAFIQKPGRAMAFLNKISFPGDAASADFSKESAVVQSIFIHEMVHVWQHQNNVLNTVYQFGRLMLKHRFDYDQAYLYTLEKGRELTSYNMEQQAMIVQDHFLRSRFNLAAAHRPACQNTPVQNNGPLYDSVLEKFHRNPAYVKTR